MYYDRQQAITYANRYWNEPSPHYETFGVDCTNFVSQCLAAGRIPMERTGQRQTGWWYEGRKNQGQEWWSYSWAVAHALYVYMRGAPQTMRTKEVRSVEELAIGDVIFYDFGGAGRMGHSTIVTVHDGRGNVRVNAHTTSSYKRVWHYRDSDAWTPQTTYRFVHVEE